MTGMAIGVPQLSGNRIGVLQRLVQRVEATRVRALEIGSYEGGSAIAIAQAIHLHCAQGGALLCVDTWKPYLFTPHHHIAEEMDRDLAAGAVLERFKLNIRLAPENVPIDFFQGTIHDASAITAGVEFNFIFIDGSHRYKDVIADLKAASLLLSEGGILCGDDLERQGAVDPALEESEWYDNFHPGVTRACWEFFGGEVWSDGGVWGARKSAAGWVAP